MKNLMLLLTALALIVSMGAMEVLAAGCRFQDRHHGNRHRRTCH